MRANHSIVLLWSAALAALSSTACYVLSGDAETQAALDDFAQGRILGSTCSLDVGGEGLESLSSATTYRARSFDGLVRDVVSPSGLVRYPLLLDDAELLLLAQQSVAELPHIDATQLTSHEAKLAFWINAYNAYALVQAAFAFDADSTFRVDENGFVFFDAPIVIGQQTLSLNLIEQGVLRGTRFHASTGGLSDEEWAVIQALHDDLWADAPFDPRFHFVLNCASSSCPRLPAHALAAGTLENDLEAYTQAFLNDSAIGASEEGISAIFDFYYDDFERVGGLEAFIGRYRDLDDVNTNRFLFYDWSLNLAAD